MKNRKIMQVWKKRMQTGAHRDRTHDPGFKLWKPTRWPTELACFTVWKRNKWIIRVISPLLPPSRHPSSSPIWIFEASVGLCSTLWFLAKSKTQHMQYKWHLRPWFDSGHYPEFIGIGLEVQFFLFEETLIRNQKP